MEIREGKFFKNGIHVPVEFGNREQIMALRKAESIVAQLESEEGLEIELDVEEIHRYLCNASFQCLCGNKLRIREQEFDENDFIKIEQDVKCKCGQKYSVESGDCSDDLVVKLLK